MKNPEGYETVASFKGGEVLASGRRVVVIGTPDDACDANGDSLHNCDAMGCGQSHVVAIVDRPAPSAQPPPALDLDALAEAERAMTAGAWSMRRESHFIQIRASDLEELLTTEQAKGGDVFNAAGIIALRNAAPHLIAEARAAVALRQELATMAERLAEAERLGLESCSIAIEAYGPADDECPARAIRAALEAL